MGYIYLIRCTVNNKVYIGQTYKTIENRLQEHKRSARAYALYKEGKRENKPHVCPKICGAMIKYGFDSFAIEILEEAPKEQLDDLEIKYIAQYDSVKNGYNVRYGGETSEYSEEHKKANSLKSRKHGDLLEGLPMYCIYKIGKDNTGYAINRHPKCTHKSFTIAKYKTVENAKAALLVYYERLEQGLIDEVKPLSEFPKGIKKMGDGYTVKKYVKRILYYKSFNKGSNEENLRDALAYLDSIVNPIPLPIQN